jgi:hypothetical protein
MQRGTGRFGVAALAISLLLLPAAGQMPVVQDRLTDAGRVTGQRSKKAQGGRVISAVPEKNTAIQEDSDIDILAFHAAHSVKSVNQAFDDHGRHGKPILISDDGCSWSKDNPANMLVALELALRRGGHFEHLDPDMSDREENGLPVRTIGDFTPRSIQHLENLSRHGQSLPYPGVLTRSAGKLFWNGREIHLVGFAAYGIVAAPTADIDGYLDVLVKYKINFTRVFALDRWANKGCSLTPFGLVSGDGCPGSTFDISQFDEKYFTRLRQFVTAAARRGIVVQYCLFDRCGLQKASHAPERWGRNPYNPANNINGLFNLDGRSYPPAFTQTTGEGADLHRAFLNKVVATIGDCGNVVYEIFNEPMDSFPKIPEFHAWTADVLREAFTARASAPSAGE